MLEYHSRSAGRCDAPLRSASASPRPVVATGRAGPAIHRNQYGHRRVNRPYPVFVVVLDHARVAELGSLVIQVAAGLGRHAQGDCTMTPVTRLTSAGTSTPPASSTVPKRPPHWVTCPSVHTTSGRRSARHPDQVPKADERRHDSRANGRTRPRNVAGTRGLELESRRHPAGGAGHRPRRRSPERPERGRVNGRRTCPSESTICPLKSALFRIPVHHSR